MKEKEKKPLTLGRIARKAFIVLICIIVIAVAAILLIARLAYGINLLALTGMGKIQEVKQEEYYDEDGKYRHATAENQMRFFYQHPIFAGNKYLYTNMEDKYLNLVEATKLPVFCQSQNRSMEVCLEAFNYLIDTANEGKAETLPCFYSEEEIAVHPEKANVQGVFYRGESNMPLAIVCAGGGMITVVSDYEGYPYAMELHKAGYNVVVLNYRVRADQLYTDDINKQSIEAAKDLTQAVKWLMDKEEELGINMEGYGLFGSSAGGMLIDVFSFAEFPGNYRESGLPKPAVIVPIYGLPVTVNITEADKGIAIFERVGKDDEYGFGDIAEKLDDITKVLGEDNVDIRVLDDFPHGVGLGMGTEGEGWIYDAMSFWETHR